MEIGPAAHGLIGLTGLLAGVAALLILIKKGVWVFTGREDHIYLPFGWWAILGIGLLFSIAWLILRQLV